MGIPLNLTIDKLAPGMELGADVFNCNQGLLLGKGTVLNERHLRILKTWGIVQVKIAQEGADSEATAEEPALPVEAVRAATEEVDALFRFVQSGLPGIQQVRELAIQRGARQIVRKGSILPISTE